MQGRGSGAGAFRTDRNVQIVVPPQKIACGFYHTLAVSNGQEGSCNVYSWGQNQHHILGYPAKQCRELSDGAEKGLTGRVEPTRVDHKGLQGHIYEVACGVNHTVFLKKSPRDHGGVVFVAGFGKDGRLAMTNPYARGTDTDDQEDWCTDVEPLQVKFRWQSGTRVLRIACGADHTLVYATNGQLYAWGGDDKGQCGVGGGGVGCCILEPQEVRFPSMNGIRHFTAGSQHSLAVFGKEGDIYTWGAGANGRLGIGSTASVNVPTCIVTAEVYQFAFVAGGEAHSGALDVDGHVFMWGAGSYGRLGFKDEGDTKCPRALRFADSSQAGAKVVSIALGGFHSLFLEENAGGTASQIYSCGSGPATGLGHEDPFPVYPPVLLETFEEGSMVVQIAAGMFHSLAMYDNGAVYAWGVGMGGRLGLHSEVTRPKPHSIPDFIAFKSTKEPLQHAMESAAAEVEAESLCEEDAVRGSLAQMGCGASHTVVRTHQGALYVWGYGDRGQLGLGERLTCVWQPRALVVQRRKIMQVAVGYEHCLAVTTLLELFAWGRGSDGQLGSGYIRDTQDPQKIVDIEDVVACAAGEVHSAAVVKNQDLTHSVWTWGSANSGMLGIGEDYFSGIHCEPKKVTAPDFLKQPMGNGPVAVRCGQSHTAVIMGRLGMSSRDQIYTDVWTFGNGTYGKLGLGSCDNAYTPKRVQLRGVVPQDVVCGAYHSCMLSKAGELWVWGRKELVCESQDIDTPKKFNQIEDSPTLKFVACGPEHTLVVTTTGIVFGWGENSNGQVGVPGFKDVSLPEMVQFNAAAQILATGSGHTVVDLENYETVAFGNQSLGRLGLTVKQEEKIIPVPATVASAWAEAPVRRAGPRPKQAVKRPEQKEVVDKATPQQDVKTVAIADVDRQQQPEEAEAAGLEEKDEEDESAVVLTKQTVSLCDFCGIQRLLAQEEDRQSASSLEQFASRMQKGIEAELEEIRRLPETEGALELLESRVDQSVRKNIGVLKMHLPDRTCKVAEDAKFLKALPHYRVLLWVMCHQTSYWAALSRCIESDEDVDVFFRVLERTYASPSHRTQNIFQRMLRLLVKKQLESTSHGTSTDLAHSPTGSTSVLCQVFSRSVLSQMHAREVVHKYMKVEPKAPVEERTLLQEVIHSSENDMFSLSFEAYKDNLNDEDKKRDLQDLRSGFNEALDSFRDFMCGPFIRAVSSVPLPKDIKQLFGFILLQTGNQPSSKGDGEDTSDLPEELRSCEPLLNFFFRALLIPLLRGSQKYVSKEYFLDAKDIQSPTVQPNMETIADFLEMLLAGTLSPKDMSQKILLYAAKQVKRKLLKYVKEQGDVVDELEVDMLCDTILSHYSREKDVVQVSAVHCLRFSNMLKVNMARLRLKENDALEILCAQIPEWSQEDIRWAESNPLVYNMVLDPRFFLSGEPLLMCLDSCRILPAQFCGGWVAKSLIRHYREEDPEAPMKKLEGILKSIEPVTASTMLELKRELQRLQNKQERMLTSDFSQIQSLRDGIRLIDDMTRQEVHPEEFITSMRNGHAERSRQYMYLKGIDNLLRTAHQRREAYLKELERWKVEMESVLDFSLELKLPEALLKHQTGGRRFKFDQAAANMRKTQHFDPSQMKAMGAALAPVATQSMKELIKGKVVSEVHPPFSAMQKDMRVTFKMLPAGGIELIVMVVMGANQNTVKRLEITNNRLEELTRARKGDTADIGEPPFFTCGCLELVALVSKLQTGKQKK